MKEKKSVCLFDVLYHFVFTVIFKIIIIVYDNFLIQRNLEINKVFNLLE